MGKNPTDRGKIGTKRSVLTEGGGVPIGLAVEGAHRHAFKMVRETLRSIPIARPTPTPEQLQGICLDKGDDDDEVRELLAEFGFTTHIRAWGKEVMARKQEARLKARRWVVERTVNGMNRFRHVLIRWDKNVCNYLAFLHMVCANNYLQASWSIGISS